MKPSQDRGITIAMECSWKESVIDRVGHLSPPGYYRSSPVMLSGERSALPRDAEK
jgi:hypothetical protein